MPASWTADGDDATVQPGAMAPAAVRAVHDGSPCTVAGCVAKGQAHAAGFRHVPRGHGPKPRGLSRVAKADAARRERAAKALEAARGDREPYPAAVLVPAKARGLVVYSRTPWAWRTDRAGVPVPAKGAA